MPVYAFKGLNGAGKSVSGTRDADGAKALRAALRKDGIFLTEMREVAAGAAVRRGGAAKTSGLKREVDLGAMFERVRTQDVAVFTRQMGTLLKAGIPLSEALNAVGEQADNRKLQMIVTEVRQKVNQGTALADALAAHPRVFPELYVNMVRSGEAAGNLDSVLMRLADFLDTQHALQSKVTGALVYPIIMTIVSILVIGVLMVVVVPKLTAMFDDLEKALPWNTELLIFVSGAIGSYWWAIALFFGGGWYIFRRWRRTPRGRLAVDRMRLRLWLIGPLSRFVGVARFSRTLATLLSAGVPVLTALEIVKRVLNNAVIEKVVEEARDAIREGESIAATLRRSNQFPTMMCHMVAVGERSGQLETMLENVASAYEREVEGKVARLTAVLSPVIIIVMALVVVFIVFSVLQPILDMQNFMQG